MANTFHQIHIQVVFAVKFRDSVIHKFWQDELYKYITGIVQDEKHKHKLLAIGGMPDHVHILIGVRPTQAVSDLLYNIKSHSSKWINERKFCKTRFEWQEGYGAFSYTKSDVPTVINYILTQEEHHKTKTFREEYLHILRRLDIEFDEQYIFHEPI